MADLRERLGVSEVRGDLPAAVVASIEAATAAHATLEDVVRWGLSQEPPRLVEQVVVQDEYTHDVVVSWAGGVYLVYDTT
jgi:hypothetical protein